MNHPALASRALRALACTSIALLLSACGGGEAPESPGTPPAAQAAMAALRAEARALAASVSFSAAATMLFDAAETIYPEIFSSHEPDQVVPFHGATLKLRYYPGTGVYLVVVLEAGTTGFETGGVYAVGGPFTEVTYGGPLTYYLPGIAQPNGTTTPATVHASFVGTRQLVFAKGSGEGCTTICTYTESQAVPVTIGSDGTLHIGGRILTNPFHRNLGAGPHLPEIIWLDTIANVEYALSDNAGGSFSEINVGDASRPASPGAIPHFLGQLRPPATGSLGALAGQYPLAWAYRGVAPAWTSMTIGSDGSISFNGGAGPNVTASNVATVTNRVPCCGRVDVEFNVDVTGDGIATDQLHIYLDSEGAVYSVEYDAGNVNNLYDDVGVRLGSVAALPAHDGTAVPATNSISGTVNGTAMDFAINWASASSNMISLEATQAGSGAQPSWLVMVQPGSALVQGATYSCRATGSSTVRVQARLAPGAPYRTTDYGGRCSVTITKLVTNLAGQATDVEGTFVAEMLDFKPSSGISAVTNGVFRFKP